MNDARITLQPYATAPNAPQDYDAVFYPSSHFDARPAGTVISLIVIHAISLPEGDYASDNALHLLTGNTQRAPELAAMQAATGRVSAHFFIRRCGARILLVSPTFRAWHAGISTFQGRERCNDFSIGIELEGVIGALFRPAQYASLARLIAQLRRAHPIQCITGHADIAPNRKHDPGAGFDWAGLNHHLLTRG